MGRLNPGVAMAMERRRMRGCTPDGRNVRLSGAAAKSVEREATLCAPTPKTRIYITSSVGGLPNPRATYRPTPPVVPKLWQILNRAGLFTRACGYSEQI